MGKNPTHFSDQDPEPKFLHLSAVERSASVTLEGRRRLIERFLLEGLSGMANQPKPAELRVLQGNPRQHKIKVSDAIAPLEYGYVEPLRPLGVAGKKFWDSIFGAGEMWISIRTDTQLVQLVCEQLDRRERLLELWQDNPSDRSLNMSLFDVEKQIVSGLSLLGFSPADRTRLGLVSAKTKSKLQELLDAKKADGK